MKMLLTLFIAFSSPIWLLAQEEGIPESKTIGQFKLNFTTAFPLGDFADKMDDQAFGVDVAFMAKLPKKPFYAGLGFDYLSFGHKTIRVRETIGNTGFESDLNWTTRSQALLLFGVFQWQPDWESRVVPYLEGSFGGRRLYTSTSLTDRNNGDDDGANSLGNDLELSDWSLFYAGTVGLKVLLDRKEKVSLDLSCQYLRANAADFYAKKNNIGDVEAPQDAFELKRASATDMLLPRIGISFLFSDKIED